MLTRIITTVFFVSLFIGETSTLFAQNDSIRLDSILLKDSFYGYSYYYQGEKISGNNVLDLLEDYPEIYDQFKSANEAFVFASVFSVVGIALIATPGGMALAGYDPNWSMAWAGAGLMLVSAPLIYKYNKNVPIALDKYTSVPFAQKKVEAEVYIGATPHGLGLCINF